MSICKCCKKSVWSNERKDKSTHNFLTSTFTVFFSYNVGWTFYETLPPVPVQGILQSGSDVIHIFLHSSLLAFLRASRRCQLQNSFSLPLTRPYHRSLLILRTTFNYSNPLLSASSSLLIHSCKKQHLVTPIHIGQQALHS